MVEKGPFSIQSVTWFRHQQLVLVEEAVKLEVPVSLSGVLACKDFGPSVVAYVKTTGRYRGLGLLRKF